MLARQDGSIPVFLKRAANQWMYDGRYRAKGLIEERDYIERKQRRAGRSDVVLALLLEPAEVAYDTYLLTWNPRNWPWNDLEEMVELTAEGRPVDDHWSCGNTKRIRTGDRLFLLRQGEEPRGIMAAGWATSETYEGPHWDEARRERGENALRVNLRYERILNPEVDEILTLDRLQSGPLASVNWATPASGIQIKQGIDDLERLWGELVGLYGGVLVGVEDAGALEGELRMALCRHRARERSLRDEKIAQAKAAHDGRLPCEVCGFDFLEVYGDIGRDYAQVHHLKPLGDRTKPSLTRLDELAIVCANCHAMAHRGGQVRPLEGLLAQRL
jgi:5-methylcytosine-specific restriction protein A